MSLVQYETSEIASNSEVSASGSLIKLQRSRWLLVVSFFLAGCSGVSAISSEAPHYAGTFENSCSPVDAPMILFDLYRLGDPEPPMVSISVWDFEFPIEGSQIDLRERGGYGAAFLGGTEWIPAKDGAISFEEYEEGEVARGWFWLDIDGIERVEGQFEATWNDVGPSICG